jgi:hypothetical protein
MSNPVSLGTASLTGHLLGDPFGSRLVDLTGVRTHMAAVRPRNVKTHWCSEI